MSCQKITAENCKELLSSVDTVMVDCDGVLWNGDEAIPGAASTLSMLKKMNKKVVYVTNNSTKSIKSFMLKFNKLGFDVSEDELFSPSVCAASYLVEQNFKGTAYVIGSQGIADELDRVGIKHFGVGPDPMKTNVLTEWLTNDLQLENNVGAVIMGFDPYVSLPKYAKASSYLNRRPDSHFILTNEDLLFPARSGIVLPGTGSIISPVLKATSRSPVVLGKPHKYIFEAIHKVHNIDPTRTLMIGDNLTTDIMFGANNNFFATILVLSGVCQLSDVEKCKSSENTEDKKLIPTHYTDDITDFSKLLQH